MDKTEILFKSEGWQAVCILMSDLYINYQLSVEHTCPTILNYSGRKWSDVDFLIGQNRTLLGL